jgi:signal transduction histidine kinase/CheY-like chemotaxis protein/HPt (histidine-containing phosphotransfer) domain-containing protein
MDVQNRFCAAAVARFVAPIEANTPIRDAVARFKGDPTLTALPLLDGGGQVAALLDRQRVMNALADPLHASVYLRRAASMLAEKSVLAVPPHMALDAVAQEIHDKHPQAMTSGFVVMDGRDYVGLAAPLDLMQAVAQQAKETAAALAVARQAAEQANRAKSVFLATMSHEIRTPLAGVIANLELLGTTTLDSDQGELARAAGTAAQTLLALIGDILDFSKIEAEQMALERIAVDPRELAHDAADLVRARCQSKGLALGVHIDAQVPARIAGDPVRLRQVLMNFLSNAVKFTDAGGIRLMVRAFEGDDRKIVLRFAVHDTGIGFDPRKIEDLFQPFQQEEQSTARRFGGTGLGLAICRRLADLMDGRIEVDAAAGQGASFALLFPSEALAPPPAPPATLPQRRIGVVGGAPAWREEVCAALAAAGANPHPFAVGMLAHLDGLVFDAVIGAEPARPQDVAALAGKNASLWVLPTDTMVARRTALRAGIWDWMARDAAPAQLAQALGHLLVPAARAARPDPAALPDLGPQIGKRRILVADDVAMNRDVVARQLAKMGLAVDLAADGVEALALADHRRHALVLTDVSMPTMDGYQFVQALRARETSRGLPRLPVLALTAHALAGDAERGREVGMDGYLTKPVSLADLAHAVQRWLGAGEGATVEAGLSDRGPPVPGPRAPRPHEADNAAFDVSALADLVGDDDPAVLSELLRVFAAQIAETAAVFEHAAAQPALRAAAHQIKGCARNVGAHSLGDMAADLEQAAANGAAAPGAVQALAAFAHRTAAFARDEAERLETTEKVG